jgi:hypothetical protein
MIGLLTATGLSIAALAMVYYSWRTQITALFYAGFSLLILSCIGWSYSQGWEYGLVYALCLPGVLVWPFIGANQVQLPAPKNTPQARPISISIKSVGFHAGNYLVNLILLMLTSILMSFALCRLLPMTFTGQIATAIILQPIVWGLLSYHYLATTAKLKAIGAYVTISIASAGALIYLPGME